MSLIAALLIAMGDPASLPPERPATSAAGTVQVQSMESYAERERNAPELAQFRGGSGGLVVLIVVVVAVLVLVAIILPW